VNILTIFIIAVGLAMDAFAVSINSGLVIRPLKLTQALKIAFFFGGFQALMPLAGWLMGYSMRDYIVSIDHWIAFVSLTVIGLKMIYEATKPDLEKTEGNPLKTGTLLILAIATSIDALAVGVSFAFLNSSIMFASIVIGAITFFISLSGVYIGNKIGHFFEKGAEIAGGVVLIIIGVTMLFS